MAVPLSQGLTVFWYVMKQKIMRRKKYPLVLMLEPLFRCNLACKGCGKIQYPDDTLKRYMTAQECLDAVDECGVPIVSIPGGEPLIHPEIKEIVEGLVKKKKYIYLCTNAILLERKLNLFKPSKYLTFSVHLDGLKKAHDESVCRDGVFDQAVKAIKSAVAKGYRVTTNTTLFDDGHNIDEIRQFFDFVADELKIEGMMISPGYPYDKAPDQEHFFKRNKTKEFFQQVLANRKDKWKFNHSPFFLDFLMGKKDYQCTPWGNPTRNIFGWQKPCYLLGEGYTRTFKELMETTDWDKYGVGKNEKCDDCMVHCGFEPTAVIDTFSSIRNLAYAAKHSS